MNRFLVYLSEQIVQDTKTLNAVMQEVNKIGSLRPGDFNIYVAETAESGEAVRQAISSVIPAGRAYFVATLDQLGYAGDQQFSSTMRLLDAQTRRHDT